MALLLAHFHRGRNSKVSGKAKWVRKAPHCKKLSNPVRHRAVLGRGCGHAAPGRKALASCKIKLLLLNSSLLQSVREQLCQSGKNPGKLLKHSYY